MIVPGYGWHQVNDVFTKASAGPVEIAYAKVKVLTPGVKVWVYGSVVDSGTGDPTTITLIRR